MSEMMNEDSYAAQLVKKWEAADPRDRQRGEKNGARLTVVGGGELQLNPGGVTALKDPETLRIEALAERIKVRHFEEIKLSTECRHLVYNLIPRRGLVVVWGPPKCGKTFWVYDLKMHVSRGLRYRGKDVVQGAVIYCMFEGQGGADTRAEAYRQEILQGEDPGQFYDVTLSLDLIKDHPALIMAIKRQLGDVKPVAITLDTLNRSLFGSESSDEDMAAYIRAAGAVIEAFDCAVIVIHHCGHNEQRPRGHSALLGAEDAEIAVKRLADDKTIVAEVIRMKDGPEGEKVAFTLKTVIVGKDVRGNDMTSCVVEPCEDTPAAISKAKGSGWTKTLRLVQRSIAEAILQAGVNHRVGGDGPTVKAAPLKLARDIHNKKYVYTGEGDRDNAQRQAWHQHTKKALESDLIGGEPNNGQDLVWFVKEENSK
jgi:hypothetical protein